MPVPLGGSGRRAALGTQTFCVTPRSAPPPPSDAVHYSQTPSIAPARAPAAAGLIRAGRSPAVPGRAGPSEPVRLRHGSEWRWRATAQGVGRKRGMSRSRQVVRARELTERSADARSRRRSQRVGVGLAASHHRRTGVAGRREHAAVRIAYFSDSLPPLVDGVTRTLGRLFDTLLAEGIEFRVYSAFQPAPCAWSDRVR